MRLSSETKIIVFFVLITILIFGVGIYLSSQTNSPFIDSSNKNANENEIISRTAIHWHPKLLIYIKGEKQGLEDGIGLGKTHEPLHTHTEDYKQDVVHMEIPGVVTKDQTRLGKFFQIWGKQFNSNCIFDKCNGKDGKVKMMVNGKENKEFENYHMQNGDIIEIRYE